MKTQIKQLKLTVLIMLVIEALITLSMVTWSSLPSTSKKNAQDIILINFVLGYVMFLIHLAFFFLRRKIIIKRFNGSIENHQIFASYVYKRSYVHNILILYTSFFVLAFSMLCNIVFLFIKNEDDFSLNLLSILSAAIVIASPFLGTVYKKVTNITQVESDMKTNAIRNNIKYCVFNSNSLKESLDEIETILRTISLIKENPDLESEKIIERLKNKISNIEEEITLFENYLLFESTVKKITDGKKQKKFLNLLIKQKELKNVFKLIKKRQKQEKDV